MSYDRPYRGGGHRRKQRDDYDYHDRRREIYETPEQKLRTTILKLGEVDPIQELPQVVKQIREEALTLVPAVSEGFRIGVTEQPYKIPYYAALLRLLYEPAEGEAPSDGTPIGRQILDDFWKGFQAFLDKLAWREIRLCIHFFAHLTLAKIVTPQSMFGLLQAFTAVLDEFGASHGRAKQAALCAAEGLMIGGPDLISASVTYTAEVIKAIQVYAETTASAKWIVQPMVNLHSDENTLGNADELLDTVISSLKSLEAEDFAQSSTSFPQPYAALPEFDTAHSFEIPSVLVPPEVIELDSLSTDSGEDSQVKKEEWPDYYFRLFDNSVTPDPTTPSGYAVRSGLLDIIDIFEVNRKECARLLLEYPKWTVPGTFKPQPGAPAQDEPVVGKDWQLENTLIETILGSLFSLPESSYKSVYYISLITELCKLSPSTVGPAVGKSIRRLYGNLADGLDVEVARKFAEWFAVHMSNFGFQWVWKEWVPDLALAIQHPKRAFMRRALEFEIRLSYHDRIAKTLPEPMRAEDAHTIQDQTPGPDFEYDDSTKPHHDAAQSVLNLLRGRSKAEEVISHLETLRHTLETSEADLNIDSIIRSIAVQSLLHMGSRSFSHLLNAIERYLPLLRSLAAARSGSGSPEAKADILSAAAAFWKRNRHMVGIVFDKLMQYQIVDPTDVVAWTFLNSSHLSKPNSSKNRYSLGAFEWDLLKGALDKANGRVMIARRRIIVLRKEEDDNRARAKASDGADMEVDADAKPDDTPAIDSPALTTALKAFTSLTREQKAALSRTLDGFVSCLIPADIDGSSDSLPREVISEHQWNNRANWGEGEWNSWETWAWYRHFCRAYSPYLRNYANTLGTISFARLEGSDDPAVSLLKRIWNVATGQE